MIFNVNEASATGGSVVAGPVSATVLVKEDAAVAVCAGAVFVTTWDKQKKS